MPSSKSVSIWIVKRDSRFYRFLSFQSFPFHLPPFLSSPSLDAFTKVSALNDTLKFEAHILRRVRQLRRHSELWTSALLHDGSLPMTRELLGSPVFNPLLYTNHPLSSCVFNYRRNSFEIYLYPCIVVHSCSFLLLIVKNMERRREKEKKRYSSPLSNNNLHILSSLQFLILIILGDIFL